MRSDSEEGKKKGKRKAAGKLSSAKKKAKGQQEKLPAPGSLPTAKRKQGKQKDTGANTVCLARKQLELLQELTASVTRQASCKMFVLLIRFMYDNVPCNV